MSKRVRVGDAEFELDFEVPTEDPLPPGVEWTEDNGEESWPAGTPAELVAYAHELAISPDQVGHWVAFLTGHPQGQLAWEEIHRVWKPPRRRKARTPQAPARKRSLRR
jgi:hypothetical protein